METTKSIKKNLVGTVISDRMDKTVVVKVERSYIHPRVQKVVRTDKKYKVHDEKEIAREGDIVEIYEGRPISKTKYMYLSRVLESNGILQGTQEISE
jgi:small subunit ribosomal protein S17